MPAVGGKCRAVVLFFYLAQGGIGSLVNLQLEDIDEVACLHHYVHAAIGSMPLNVYIQAHQLEQHIYHVLEIYLLVAHYLIVATGKQTLQAVHEAFRIARAHFLYEVAYLEWSLLRGLGGIEGNEIPDEAFANLTVGKAKEIALELLVIARYREITALIKQRQRVLVHDVDAVQRVCRQLFLCHPSQGIVRLLQLLNEERRGAGFKPIVAELAAVERIQYAERVVKPDSVVFKVIAVEVFLQTTVTFILAEAIGCAKLTHTLVEVVVKFLLSDATYFYIATVERYILKVIQVTEHAYLAKLRHTRQEGKADILVARLQGSVECLERGTVFSLQRVVINRLQ